MATRNGAALVEQVRVRAFAVPTDAPEADGTLSWDRTVLVAVELSSEGVLGLGYTYADVSTAKLIESMLAGVVLGAEVFAPQKSYVRMVQAVRNLGHTGIAAMAISALDAALWDLKARLLELSMADLLGRVRDASPLYGSGGFTAYDIARLQAQLSGWAEQGIQRVKMKIGSEPSADLERVTQARRALGDGVELFVDANGAYERKQALAQAERFAKLGVTWFEEPVSSQDLPGLALLVARAPASMNIAAGEYGYDLPYFERLLARRAVDVLQADATRCGGVSGFMAVAALCDAHGAPLSAHCAPALHVHLGCAAARLVHLEYFYDHVRIEQLLFDGVPRPQAGLLAPERSRAGFGFSIRAEEARRYVIADATRRKE